MITVERSTDADTVLFALMHCRIIYYIMVLLSVPQFRAFSTDYFHRYSLRMSSHWLSVVVNATGEHHNITIFHVRHTKGAVTRHCRRRSFFAINNVGRQRTCSISLKLTQFETHGLFPWTGSWTKDPLPMFYAL